MFPWLFLWSPQIHFPFSGAVTQDISPDTFFGWINPAAGDGKIEREIFDSASYGKQIGILSEVVLSLVDSKSIFAAERRHAIEQLESIHADVSAIKSKHRKRKVESATRLLEQLQQSAPEEVERIIEKFQRTLPRLPAP